MYHYYFLILNHYFPNWLISYRFPKRVSIVCFNYFILYKWMGMSVSFIQYLLYRCPYESNKRFTKIQSFASKWNVKWLFFLFSQLDEFHSYLIYETNETIVNCSIDDANDETIMYKKYCTFLYEFDWYISTLQNKKNYTTYYIRLKEVQVRLLIIIMVLSSVDSLYMNVHYRWTAKTTSTCG